MQAAAILADEFPLHWSARNMPLSPTLTHSPSTTATTSTAAAPDCHVHKLSAVAAASSARERRATSADKCSATSSPLRSSSTAINGTGSPHDTIMVLPNPAHHDPAVIGPSEETAATAAAASSTPVLKHCTNQKPSGVLHTLQLSVPLSPRNHAVEQGAPTVSTSSSPSSARGQTNRKDAEVSPRMSTSTPASSASPAPMVPSSSSAAGDVLKTARTTSPLFAANTTPKRQHKPATAPHTHRRSANASGQGKSSHANSSKEKAEASDVRTAAERCKAARALAAELMSALMERPPEAAQIAQYRVRRLRSSSAALSSLSLSASGLTRAAAKEGMSEVGSKRTNKGQPQQHSMLADVQDGTANTTASAASRALPSSSSQSFLDAVRNGKTKTSAATTPVHAAAALPLKSGHTTSAAAETCASLTPTPPLTHVSNTTGNGGDRAHHRSASAGHTASTSAEPHMKGPGHLELIPEDMSTIPRLLSLLREIALACAPLEVLRKASARSDTAATAAPANESAASAYLMPSGSSASNSGSGASKRNPSHREMEDIYEEQWQRVRQHLHAVRALVLNDQELASALDDTLGCEWRTLRAAAEHDEHKAPLLGSDDFSFADALMLPPAAEGVSRPSRPHTASVTPAGGSGGAVVPVMPVPVDHGSTPRATASTTVASAVHSTAGAAPASAKATAEASEAIAIASVTNTNAASASHRTTKGSLTSTATSMLTSTNTVATTNPVTTTTPLNHNARPFHSRTPPTYGAQQSLIAAASGKGPTYGRHSAVAISQATSMRQLSESSSTYSPSQHVATFLERTTPPLSGQLLEENTGGKESTHNGSGGLLSFPATPLSEAAAPYQPTMSLVGPESSTSPRGTHSTGTASPSTTTTPFHLESREEMLRRRSAAPNAFYASMSHSGATHYLGGLPSAATTPGTFVPSAGPLGSPSFPMANSGARSMPVSPLLSFGSPVTANSCPYDYLLVLDFEATCEEHPPPNYLYEIIEFPVVVVDVRLQRVVAEFHRFVQPRYKVELSPFCKELTGMRQDDVDAAAPLEDVIVQFERWFAHTVPPHARCVFATDGPMDMREFMYHHSVSRQGIRFPPLFYQYIDVKHTFACFFQCSQGKIKAMLEVLHVPFEGRLHSGLDDARNIAAIVIGLLQYGCNFCEVPLNRLPLNGLLLSGGVGSGGSSSSNIMGGSSSTPLSLPPSTATAASSSARHHPHRTSAMSPTCIAAAPYAVDENEYSY